MKLLAVSVLSTLSMLYLIDHKHRICPSAEVQEGSFFLGIKLRNDCGRKYHRAFLAVRKTTDICTLVTTID
jgi:hypothetical protein